MAQHHDTEYLKLVEDVLKHGSLKGDRTGTGTYSVFGRQMRFDLSDGTIPLLTSKKMHTHSIIHELLWYLTGSANSKVLKDNNVRIWNEWSSAEGNLNKVYGRQWRKWEHLDWKKEITKVPNKWDVKGIVPTNITCNYSEFGDKVHYYSAALELWYSIIHLCQTPPREFDIQPAYTMSNEWTDFNNFLRDLPDLVYFDLWASNPDKYEMSPLYFNSSCFSKDTVVFLPVEYFEFLRDNQSCITSEESLTFVYHKRENTDNNSSSFDHFPTLGWNNYYNTEKNKDNRDDYTFVYRQKLYTDQIETVVNTLLTNPDSRRMIVSAWNVSDVETMNLPPCHYTFQFYTTLNADTGRRTLSCMLNQRSCDVGLGVPFNIAQYSILTHMVAAAVDMDVGDFVWNGGDVHIYTNHVEQLAMQTTRTLYPSPKLELSVDRTKSAMEIINGFKPEDFSIKDYMHSPTIKMEVAV